MTMYSASDAPTSVKLCKTYGFARMEGAFSKDEVDKMRAEALLALHRGSQLEVMNGFPTIMYHPNSEYLQAISKDPRILEVVMLHLGENELQTQQWYFHLPGDSDEFAWHTDERFRPGVGDYYLQTAVLIDDWAEENSAVEFIPKSHKQPFNQSTELRKFIRDGKNGVKLTGKAGDLLMWSNIVVHGSERNVSNKSRMYYMNGYQCV